MKLGVGVVAIIMVILVAGSTCLLSKIPTSMVVYPRFDEDSGILYLTALLNYIDPANGESHPLPNQPVTINITYTSADEGEQNIIANAITDGRGMVKYSKALKTPKRYEAKVIFEGGSQFDRCEATTGTKSSAITPADLPPGVNLTACWPLFLALGLLGAAAYYSGRNPFGIIDTAARGGFRVRRRAIKQYATQSWVGLGMQIGGSLMKMVGRVANADITPQSEPPKKGEEGEKKAASSTATGAPENVSPAPPAKGGKGKEKAASPPITGGPSGTPAKLSSEGKPPLPKIEISASKVGRVISIIGALTAIGGGYFWAARSLKTGTTKITSKDGMEIREVGFTTTDSEIGVETKYQDKIAMVLGRANGGLLGTRVEGGNKLMCGGTQIGIIEYDKQGNITNVKLTLTKEQIDKLKKDPFNPFAAQDIALLKEALKQWSEIQDALKGATVSKDGKIMLKNCGKNDDGCNTQRGKNIVQLSNLFNLFAQVSELQNKIDNEVERRYKKGEEHKAEFIEKAMKEGKSKEEAQERWNSLRKEEKQRIISEVKREIKIARTFMQNMQQCFRDGYIKVDGEKIKISDAINITLKIEAGAAAEPSGTVKKPVEVPKNAPVDTIDLLKNVNKGNLDQVTELLSRDNMLMAMMGVQSAGELRDKLVNKNGTINEDAVKKLREAVSTIKIIDIAIGTNNYAALDHVDKELLTTYMKEKYNVDISASLLKPDVNAAKEAIAAKVVATSTDPNVIMAAEQVIGRAKLEKQYILAHPDEEKVVKDLGTTALAIGIAEANNILLKVKSASELSPEESKVVSSIVQQQYGDILKQAGISLTGDKAADPVEVYTLLTAIKDGTQLPKSLQEKTKLSPDQRQSILVAAVQQQYGELLDKIRIKPTGENVDEIYNTIIAIKMGERLPTPPAGETRPGALSEGDRTALVVAVMEQQYGELLKHSYGDAKVTAANADKVYEAVRIVKTGEEIPLDTQLTSDQRKILGAQMMYAPKTDKELIEKFNNLQKLDPVSVVNISPQEAQDRLDIQTLQRFASPNSVAWQVKSIVEGVASEYLASMPSDKKKIAMQQMGVSEDQFNIMVSRNPVDIFLQVTSPEERRNLMGSSFDNIIANLGVAEAGTLPTKKEDVDAWVANIEKIQATASTGLTASLSDLAAKATIAGAKEEYGKGYDSFVAELLQPMQIRMGSDRYLDRLIGTK